LPGQSKGRRPRVGGPGHRRTRAECDGSDPARAVGRRNHGRHRTTNYFGAIIMADKSIGLIELSSVAAGFLVADTMLKAGNVRLILSRSICSGKYMVLIGGETAGVESAVAAGAEAANGCLIDQFVIANVHP